MSRLSHVVFSEVADEDLEGIYDYSETDFGQEQAISYLLSFDHAFNSLLENPQLGIVRDELKNGLRGPSHKEHIIFIVLLTNILE